MTTQQYHTLDQEYADRLEEWTTTRTCIRGAAAVKRAGTSFLPMPNPLDRSQENLTRYDQYKTRAQFVNFTGRSARGFVGLVRQREPVVDLPAKLEFMKRTATSTGVGINQLADDTVSNVLATGRRGLLAEYPEQDTGLSLAAIEALGKNAYVSPYEAEEIPEYHESVINGVRVLDFVKLVEKVETINYEGMTITDTLQYRVLRLGSIEDGGPIVYSQALYEDIGLTKIIGDLKVPKKSDGTPFDFIPFKFVGSESNDPAYDPAPLYDIADINIGHYRNSADYEESAFVVGQPMVGIITDISYDQWKVANENFGFGCRVATFLGPNGDIKLVQSQPNTLAKEAMDSKENQLKMIGAKIIETNTTAETATAAKITNGAENSVLGKIVLNTQDAILDIIGWIGLFHGVDTSSAVFEMNTKFYDPGTDPQSVMAAIALYDRQIIAKADLQDYSRKQGILDSARTNEEIDGEILEGDNI